MQIRKNEKRYHKVVNETVNGLNVVVHLVSSVNNVDIADTAYMSNQGFDPSNVTIDVQLKRDGKTFTLMSTNLAVIAHYSTIMMGQNSWLKGKVIVPKAAAVKQEVERTVFIPFFGHHNVKGSDEMVITVYNGRGTFGTGINEDASSILVTANQSIGVETGIYRFNSQALQANMTTENVNLGDNVQRVAIVSFEKDWEKPVVKAASLSSDRLDWTKSEGELFLQHQQFFPYNYSDVLMLRGWTEATMKYYPNTILFHDKDEIDQAKLSINLYPANVESSENLICWTYFETSREILTKAVEMQVKHSNENIAKVPETLVA